MRALSMPVEVAISLSWFFIRKGHLGGAFLILVGFDCFLRTGELMSLIVQDFDFDTQGIGVVRLGHIKTGRRHAAHGGSTINDPACGLLFKRFVNSLPFNTSRKNNVFLPKPYLFYKLFKEGLAWLGLSDYTFQPYSLRRGDATAFFRATRSMEATLDRGRWSSARVAKIYINDGLAREIELRFPHDLKQRLLTLVSAFGLWLRSP